MVKACDPKHSSKLTVYHCFQRSVLKFVVTWFLLYTCPNLGFWFSVKKRQSCPLVPNLLNQPTRFLKFPAYPKNQRDKSRFQAFFLKMVDKPRINVLYHLSAVCDSSVKEKYILYYRHGKIHHFLGMRNFVIKKKKKKEMKCRCQTLLIILCIWNYDIFLKNVLLFVFYKILVHALFQKQASSVVLHASFL